MNKSILERIKDHDERRFVKTIIEYSQRAQMQNRSFFVDFHNKAWMQSLLEQYVGDEIKAYCYFFGGYETAERQMLGIAPYELTEEDFPLVALEVKVKTGIGKDLSHRDFLGALLGLGIERETIGDIIIKPFGAYFIMKEELLSYIRANLISIGRYHNIDIQEIECSLLSIEPPQIKNIETTVASLRLDVIVAAGFNLSRGNANKLIQSERVKCNGIVGGTSQLVKEGDHITARGYGKIKLKQINGYTKKERLHITIEKYI